MKPLLEELDELIRGEKTSIDALREEVKFLTSEKIKALHNDLRHGSNLCEHCKWFEETAYKLECKYRPLGECVIVKEVDKCVEKILGSPPEEKVTS